MRLCCSDKAVKESQSFLQLLAQQGANLEEDLRQRYTQELPSLFNDCIRVLSVKSLNMDDISFSSRPVYEAYVDKIVEAYQADKITPGKVLFDDVLWDHDDASVQGSRKWLLDQEEDKRVLDPAFLEPGAILSLVSCNLHQCLLVLLTYVLPCMYVLQCSLNFSSFILRPCWLSLCFLCVFSIRPTRQTSCRRTRTSSSTTSYRWRGGTPLWPCRRWWPPVCPCPKSPWSALPMGCLAESLRFSAPRELKRDDAVMCQPDQLL
jgi:hypothetical protein